MTIRPRQSLLNSELKRPSALDSKPRSSNLIWLDKNENLDPVLMDLSHEVLGQIPPLALATYPEAGELYRKLAHWVGVNPDYLLLTPGSDGAIRLVFEAFVEQNDPVIHTNPTFAMYPVYGQMFGAKVHSIQYEARADGPYLDPKKILDALHSYQPKLLCLPNPDSPTGTVQPPEVIKEILKECELVGTVLLLDEAYYPFHDWSATSWTNTSRHLIVARTFAKAWGVAGLRIGYAIAHPETISFLHKMRPMYEVSTLAVEFMSRMLDKSAEMLKSTVRIKEAKRFFIEEMKSLCFETLSTNGNFVHIAFGEQSREIHAALENKVLYRKAFDHECLKGYSRFTIGSREVMTEVADLIRQVVEKK